MSEIFLIRHTKPDIPEGLCYGQSDVPYAVEEFHAWETPRVWPQACRVFSSPSKRCHDLALKAFRQPIRVDSRLMELHFGNWEAKLWQDLPRDETEVWTRDYLNRAPPAGESLQDLTQRLRSFFVDQLCTDETTLIFTHAGVIRLLLIATHEEGLDQYFARPVDYGSVHRLPRYPRASDFDRLLER